MSRTLSTESGKIEASLNPHPANEAGHQGDVSQCPFFDIVKPSLKQASANIVQDIAEVKSKDEHNQKFDYEGFFVDQVLKKKQDHSYRIFKKVARDAQNFPHAKEFSNDRSGNDVKVWCSNDYMGITTHPEVKKAIM